jgi:collagen beta-1,O-galactosyltransferase
MVISNKLAKTVCYAFCVCILMVTSVVSADNDGDNQWMSLPTVMVSVLIRNKEHTLPWFLYYLENLDYPKQRMNLW